MQGRIPARQALADVRNSAVPARTDQVVGRILAAVHRGQREVAQPGSR